MYVCIAVQNSRTLAVLRAFVNIFILKKLTSWCHGCVTLFPLQFYMMKNNVCVWVLLLLFSASLLATVELMTTYLEVCYWMFDDPVIYSTMLSSAIVQYNVE
jgi:hypothetical protein